MAELAPCGEAVEVREGEEEVRHRVALLAEELGEAVREVARVRHSTRIARDLEASGNARVGAW
jgi:phosphate uptake regulator